MLTAGPHTEAADLGQATVAAVTDGDTVVVRLDGRTERVRLVGMDAPEKDQEPWGPRAAAFLHRLVAGKPVRLETDVQNRDRYGRLLAYVWVGETMANVELVRQGYAMLYTAPPNVAHVELLREAQREARQAGRHIWSPADGLDRSPFEFRHGRPPPRSLGQDGLPRSDRANPGDLARDAPFVGNRRTRKFHASTCALAGKVGAQNRVAFATADEARAAGMIACRICKGRKQ